MIKDVRRLWGRLFFRAESLQKDAHANRNVGDALSAQQSEEAQAYLQSEYFHMTRHSLVDVHCDKGLWGEYFIFCELEGIAGARRVLCNLYVTNTQGKSSEIDMVLLHESGIYVIESKNYSGSIFGDVRYRYWTQQLRRENGHIIKNRFYNPLWQNNGHIRCLRRQLDRLEIPYYSVVVFSERCDLRKLRCKNADALLVQRDQLCSAIRLHALEQGTVLAPEQLEEIYELLYPLSQATQAQKDLHIAQFHEERANETPRPAERATPPNGVYERLSKQKNWQFCEKCAKPMLRGRNGRLECINADCHEAAAQMRI